MNAAAPEVPAAVSLAATPAVPVVTVGDTAVRPGQDAVTDAEVSRAETALRDARDWGAQYYEPSMYAGAQSALAAALSVRPTDPVQCRLLLTDAAAEAASAKAAALQAYELDVMNRFAASRAQLVEARADRAFPQEFARLLSGIQSTTDLFAAGSYLDARLEAYHTLKGMEDLYDTVRSMRDWLRDALPRVERALDAARALGASTWAPVELTDAEHRYHDGVTQAQADQLGAAVDSMKAAGLIAARLPFLHDEMARKGTLPAAARPGAESEALAAPSAPRAPAPAAAASAALPAAVAVPPAGALPAGQHLRIGTLSVSALGAPQKLFIAYQGVVARFDVVAADGLRDPGIMEKLLAGLDDSWEAAVSRSGYFGFIYRDPVQMVKELGVYSGATEFDHAPYAAQFRLTGTRFAVNLVVCHVQAGRDGQEKQIARLADVYRYFEKLTGNRGITLLLVGGLGGAPPQAAKTSAPLQEMVPLRAGPAASPGARTSGQQIFASAALRSLVQETGLGGSTPPAAWVTLGARD